MSEKYKQHESLADLVVIIAALNDFIDGAYYTAEQKTRAALQLEWYRGRLKELETAKAA